VHAPFTQVSVPSHVAQLSPFLPHALAEVPVTQAPVESTQPAQLFDSHLPLTQVCEPLQIWHALPFRPQLGPWSDGKTHSPLLQQPAQVAAHSLLPTHCPPAQTLSASQGAQTAPEAPH
jgi:hypothetical protein